MKYDSNDVNSYSTFWGESAMIRVIVPDAVSEPNKSTSVSGNW